MRRRESACTAKHTQQWLYSGSSSSTSIAYNIDIACDGNAFGAQTFDFIAGALALRNCSSVSMLRSHDVKIRGYFSYGIQRFVECIYKAMSDSESVIYDYGVTPTAPTPHTPPSALTVNESSTPTARRRKQAKPRAFKQLHHVVVPLSSSDDENDENVNELMDGQLVITASSPDLSDSSTHPSSTTPPPQRQTKTRSQLQRQLLSSDERLDERPNHNHREFA
ncbi:unnamed protein product [Oppiella nova]|uniref:Uncharacterized protein n=1 Tax=Oppiella nova TaxID=334625 RepID=A0A7R9LG02_9ACAR|nr:unnamed protein product [Oppiella nova]CAG2163297.1 unnamed protein product [Oppiella nova]